MTVLPSVATAGALLRTSFFRRGLLGNVAVTVTINAMVNFLMLREKKFPLEFVDKGTYGEVLIFCVISAVIVFGTASADVRKAVLKGTHTPVAHEALQSGLFMRLFCFSVSFTNWKARLPLFILNTLFVPASLLAWIVVAFGCRATVLARMLASSSHEMGQEGEGECGGSLVAHIALKAMWQGIAAAVIFTLNFLAASNEMSPEIAVAIAEERNKKDD